MIEKATLLDCAGCLCLASRRASRAISRSYEQKLRPHGIRIGQFSALTALILRGPLTVGVLAEYLGVERTTLTRNLALLEAKRWVTIHPGEDARSRVVEATAAGRGKINAALPAWHEAQVAAISAIGTSGTSALRRLADRALG